MNRYFMRTAMPPITRDRPAEQRADRVARGERPARNSRLARDAAPSALGLGAGQPLPATERRYFESRLGADLAGVRVHPDTEAATQLRANAFAAGRDIGFAPGRWQPGTVEGRRLLGHELAHVLEQGSNRQPAVQLDEATKPEDADKATEALTEGVKTVVEQAKENEGVKSALLDPAKNYALRQWNPLGTAEKVGVAGFGAGTYGLALGAGLADPAGRKLLSDVNLVAPLGLIPYSTLTGFSYALPATPGSPTLFKASFSGDDLLGLAHQKVSWMPPHDAQPGPGLERRPVRRGEPEHRQRGMGRDARCVAEAGQRRGARVETHGHRPGRAERHHHEVGARPCGQHPDTHGRRGVRHRGSAQGALCAGAGAGGSGR